MATLHVRNVPDDLYERLRQRAALEKRLLSAEVVHLLEQAVGRSHQGDLAALFAQIERHRKELEREVGKFPSSVDLIREDRDR